MKNSSLIDPNDLLTDAQYEAMQKKHEENLSELREMKAKENLPPKTNFSEIQSRINEFKKKRFMKKGF